MPGIAAQGMPRGPAQLLEGDFECQGCWHRVCQSARHSGTGRIFKEFRVLNCPCLHLLLGQVLVELKKSPEFDKFDSIDSVSISIRFVQFNRFQFNR